MFMAKAWPQDKAVLETFALDAIEAMASKFHRTLELKGFKKATFYMLSSQKNTILSRFIL